MPISTDLKAVTRSRIERETTITFNEEEAMAMIGTCSKPMIRHLEVKLGLVAWCRSGEWRDYKVEKGWMAIRRPKQMRLTPEARKRLGDRFVKSRLSSKNHYTAGVLTVPEHGAALPQRDACFKPTKTPKQGV